MRFGARLVLGTVIVLALTMAFLLWVSERGVRRDLEEAAVLALEREARLVREALPLDTPSRWGTVVDRVGRYSRNRISLIGTDGRILSDSDIPAARLPLEPLTSDRSEVQSALAFRVGVAIQVADVSGGRRMLFVAIPSAPIVRVGQSMEGIDQAVAAAQRSILTATLLALFVGIGLALFAGRSIARPLTALAAAAQDIARGAPPRLPHSGISEIDGLVLAFRRMHSRLERQFAALSAERGGSEALVDAMVEGVLACDARGRVIRANPAARALLGYHPDEPLPGLPTLFHAKAARDLVDASLKGDTLINRELPLDDRTFLVSARPLPEGGTVIVFHDVTTLRRLEAVRRDFVANVSHELKTPLTSIAGYTETLLEGGTDPATTRQFLGTIHKNAARMHALVDDLLDLARVEAGRFQPDVANVDVRDAFEEVWAPVAESAHRERIAFRVELGEGAECVPADAGAIRQILTNLVSNALRFTGPEGFITCRATLVEGGISIGIIDTGTGIPGDHLPRIFERFYRVDPSRSRAAGGTGLGLSIVKHLTEAHGGWVGAESAVGQGTTITCWFPNPAPDKGK